MRALVAFVVLLLGTCAVVPSARAGQQGWQVVSGARLTTLARAVIARLPRRRDQAYLPVASVADQRVPAGRIGVDVASALVSPSYVNVPIRLTLDGRLLRTIFVGYRVQRYVRMAVAAHDLAPGTVLAAADLTMHLVPFVGQQPNGTRVLIGRKIFEPVTKGQPIAIWQTHVNQIVQAGTTVVLLVRGYGVALVADVVARTSGGLGDEVSLYNPSTNKMLSGVVTGPGRAELDLRGGSSTW
ncbi:MAG: flagellar basal body P-ring formation chaperone FlgA [Vulcanimicrobiaceae bacterium]